jgi:serine protease Do
LTKDHARGCWAKKRGAEKAESLWGITVQNITSELAQKFGLDESEAGVTELSGLCRRQTAAWRRIGSQPPEGQNVRDYRQATSKDEKGRNAASACKTWRQHLHIAISAQGRRIGQFQDSGYPEKQVVTYGNGR